MYIYIWVFELTWYIACEPTVTVIKCYVMYERIYYSIYNCIHLSKHFEFKIKQAMNHLYNIYIQF